METRRIRPSLIAKGLDETLLVTYVIMMLTGLWAIYTASAMVAQHKFGSDFHFLRQQLFWVAVSCVAVFLLARVNLSRISTYSPVVLLGTTLLLGLVFIMPERNDAHRWLFLGPLTLQPSELYKFVLIWYLAFSLSNPDRDIANTKRLLFPYLPLVGAGLLLVLLQPNVSMTGIIALLAIAMFFLAGARLKHLAVGFGAAFSLGTVMVLVKGYKIQRLHDFIAALGDPLQGSYQAKQAALTIGSGGLAGNGVGSGLQKLFFLPYPHTDFIFASMGEEIGFIGLLVILVLFALLLYRGMRIASAQPDKFGFLLGSGLTLMLFVNMAIHVAVATSIIPVTGIPLPFLSYGGSSLLVSSAAVGVLLNLSRRIAR